MATRDELKSRASQIKNEVEEGRNTANRVGGLLEDFADSVATKKDLDDFQTSISSDVSDLESRYEKDYAPILAVEDEPSGSKMYDVVLFKGNTYRLINRSVATLSVSIRSISNEQTESFGNVVSWNELELRPSENGYLNVYANNVHSFDVECLNSIYYKLIQAQKDIELNKQNIDKSLREGTNITSVSQLSDANEAKLNTINLVSVDIANTPTRYGVLYSVSHGSNNYIVQYWLSSDSELFYRLKWREWSVWNKCSILDVTIPTISTHHETGNFVGELNNGKNAQALGTNVNVANGTMGSHYCLIVDAQSEKYFKVFCSWTGNANYGCGWIAVDGNGNVVDKYYGKSSESDYVFVKLPNNAVTLYVNGLDGVIPTAEITTITKEFDGYTREEIDEKIAIDINLSLFRKFGVVGDSYASGQVYWKDGSEWKSEGKYSISWGQVLARKHGNVCTNYSQGGLNTRTWLYSSTPNGVTKLLNSEKEDLYILALGINDSYGLGESYLGSLEDITNHSSYSDYADSFYGNYGRIIEKIKDYAPNSKMIMVTCANNSGIANKFNNAIIEIASHYQIPYIVQLEDYFFESNIYLDMVQGHPRGIAYCGMANAFDRLINQCLKSNYNYFKDIYMNEVN